jgi:hypothetical protein
LRARIALFRGGYALRSNKNIERRSDYLKYYEIAKKECEEIMARRDQHTLNPNFENVWRNVTSFVYDPQGEILFEVGAGGGNANSDSRMGNYDGPVLNNASRYGAGGGGIVMLPNYFYAFDSVDTRRDVTVTWYQVLSATNVKSMRQLTELNTGKYRRDWRVPLLPGTVLNVGYNWAMIRFSDVLLMYAECQNELDNRAECAKQIQRVRNRANLPDREAEFAGLSKENMRERIAHERALEFALEGHRFDDIRRWGWLQNPTKLAELKSHDAEFNSYVAGREFFSIPQAEIDVNKNLKQNSGY